MFRSLLAVGILMAAPLTGCIMTNTKDAPDTERTKIVPPLAKRQPITIEQVGRTRSDPYHWLKDDNWQEVMKDPSLLRADIRTYLEDENAFTKAELETPTAALQDTLFKEMRGRIKEDDASLPSRDGPYAYLVKYRTGGEYPIYARRPVEEIYNDAVEDTVLLDGDAMGEGEAYFSFGTVIHAPNHKLIAYSVDTQGSEYYDIYFKNIETGETLANKIPATSGDFVWNADSTAIFWVERNENGRTSAVHHYVLGTDQSVEIYREQDPGFFVGVDQSQSGEFIFITANDHTTSETHVFRADEDTPSLQLIEARTRDHQYSVEHWEDRFVILTNTDGAVDFKVVTAPINTPSKAFWTPLTDHRAGTLILGFDVLKDYLIRLEREDGLPRIVIRERMSGQEQEIAFEEAAYDLDVSVGYEYDTHQIRFDYSSPSTPDSDYDYNLVTGERVLRKTREVPSGHTSDDYVVERLMVPARDGVLVPVTLLRHKDTPARGGAPMLLYGYGSYGITISARFRTTPLSLVDRGLIYAIVHPRGSMAKGYQWYLDGKLDKKENTFNDYVDAAHFMIGENITAQGRIVGMGGSAGGLLMGAVSNQSPELFSGIIAAVPFVDVINTMSDESLPLTPPEWPEWGNPLTSAQDYDQILAYSPYDQVTDRPYPAMLITGGLSDPRVTYWEPAKWTAKLRHEAPNAGPYYLRINMEAGHGGASGRFEGLKETALEYAFALKTLGLSD